MNVLLVNEGPHENGCTYTALSVIADVLVSEGIKTKIFWIGNRAIRGCINCDRCEYIGHCAFDDCVNDFLEMASEFDGFVFGAPVHFASLPGAATSFMDRVFYADMKAGKRCFYLKPAAIITSARRAGTTATLDQFGKYLQYAQCLQVNSHYWNMVHGNCPEEVWQDKEGVQTLKILGRNLAWELKCHKVARDAGIERPVPEDRILTNFIHV